jgi:hypothetical protein
MHIIPALWEVEAGHCEFQASLGYVVIPCVKNKIRRRKEKEAFL